MTFKSFPALPSLLKTRILKKSEVFEALQLLKVNHDLRSFVLFSGPISSNFQQVEMRLFNVKIDEDNGRIVASAIRIHIIYHRISQEDNPSLSFSSDEMSWHRSDVTVRVNPLHGRLFRKLVHFADLEIRCIGESKMISPKFDVQKFLPLNKRKPLERVVFELNRDSSVTRSLLSMYNAIQVCKDVTFRFPERTRAVSAGDVNREFLQFMENRWALCERLCLEFLPFDLIKGHLSLMKENVRLLLSHDNWESLVDCVKFLVRRNHFYAYLGVHFWGDQMSREDLRNEQLTAIFLEAHTPLVKREVFGLVFHRPPHAFQYEIDHFTTRCALRKVFFDHEVV